MAYKHFDFPSYPCKEDMWDVIAKDGRPIVVYGMGNGADKLISRLEEYGVEISDFFASDGFVRGHFFHGKKVLSFSEIKEKYSDFLILLSFASNREEVLSLLSDINEKYDMLIPDMPVADILEFFDKDFFNKHYIDIRRAYDHFSDEESKNCFSAIINYKLSGKMEYLSGAFSDREDIYSIISKKNIVNMIDAGAYNGDTVREAKEYFKNLKAVIAIEPDKRNYKKLLKYSEAERIISVISINAAVWCEDSLGNFSESGNRNSSVSSTASFKHRDEEINLIALNSFSSFSANYIKYDVEGAEKEALSGSFELIRRDRPALLISLYHRSRDIFDLVNFTANNAEDYVFYLRRLRCVPAWELDLICIPKECL